METDTDMQGGSHHGAGLHTVSRDGRTLFPLSLLLLPRRPKCSSRWLCTPGFNLRSPALHISTPSDGVYISSVFTGLAALLKKEMFWEECTA